MIHDSRSTYICLSSHLCFIFSAGASEGLERSEDKDKETNVNSADPGPYFGFGISRSSANIRSSFLDLSAWLFLWFAKCP